jgi:hypothetical protein
MGGGVGGVRGADLTVFTGGFFAGALRGTAPAPTTASAASARTPASRNILEAERIRVAIVRINR